MAKSSDQIKICGLCSQLVDEPVEVAPGLRIFLISLLNIENTELPQKICLECYTHTVECKRFKDRCEKSIQKLQRNEAYANVVLGKSAKDLEAIRKTPLPSSPPASRGMKADSTKFIIETPEAPEPEEDSSPVRRIGPKSKIVRSGAKPGPASKKTVTTTPRRNNELKNLLEAQAPSELKKIFADQEPRSAAVRSRRSEAAALLNAPQENSGPRSRRSLPAPLPKKPVTRGKPKTLGPASKTRAAGQTTPSKPTTKESGPATKTAASTKKANAKGSSGGRAHGFQPVVKIRRVERQRADREFESNGCQRSKAGSKKRSAAQSQTTEPPKKRTRQVEPEEPETPKQESKSSFGRKRTAKTDTEYVYEKDVVSPSEDDDTPLHRKKAAPAGKKKPAAQENKKATPKTPKSTTKRKAAAREEIAFVEASAPVEDSDDDDDDEEMFPSIGPYQCEICQDITDTKQEFVDHIKANHIDIVDEEVLKSLERDLKKSRKKAEREKKSKNTPAKKSPHANKKSPAGNKKTAAPKPAAKKSTNTPKAPQKAKTPKKNAICKICNTVLEKTSPSEIQRHQRTRQCRAAASASEAASLEAAASQQAKESGVEPKKVAEATEVDPLDVDEDDGNVNGIAEGVDQVVGDIVSRTCQYCGKIVDDAKDLASHHTTKGCLAKKYEMQNEPEPVPDGVTSSTEVDHVEEDQQIFPENLAVVPEIPAVVTEKVPTTEPGDWNFAHAESFEHAVAANGLTAAEYVNQPGYAEQAQFVEEQTPVIAQSIIPEGF